MENILEVYEALHKRLFPSVKNSLEYLTAYVGNLLGSISDQEFNDVSLTTAMEYDDDISDEMLLKFREILEKHMGTLDYVDFAALMNVDTERVFNMNSEKYSFEILSDNRLLITSEYGQVLIPVNEIRTFGAEYDKIKQKSGDYISYTNVYFNLVDNTRLGLKIDSTVSIKDIIACVDAAEGGKL